MKFYEYIAKRDGLSLEEAAKRSLARTWELAETGKVLILISASRGENSEEINAVRNEQLKQDIRREKFGYIPVFGAYTEKIRDENGNETGETRKVLENSFLVSANFDISNENLYKIVFGWIVKYNQEAAIIKYKDSPNAFLIDRSGGQIDLGIWNKDKMAQHFTQMKYGADAKNRIFNFEHADDDSQTTQMAIHYFKKNGI